MPFARNRFERVSQTAQWLTENFPPEYPVKVKWLSVVPIPKDIQEGLTKKELEEGLYAVCSKRGKRFTITLSKRACFTRAQAVETLLHEWAHALCWKFASMEARRLSDHDDEFFLAWGRIYRAYHEYDGWKESKRFTP
jgi:hypothetical protein